MNKTILCINAAWAWTFFLTPSLAQSSLDRPITDQYRASDVATSRAGNVQRSRSVNCRTERHPQYSTDHPADPAKFPSTRKKIAPAPAVWQDLRSHHLSPSATPSSSTTPSARLAANRIRHYQTVPTAQPVIIEAQGWTRDKKGRILLTAKVSKMKAYELDLSKTGC